MDAIVSVQGVSKSYAKHQALKDVSMDIPRQSIFGLLGPNGAGKTTLIRIINQIISQDEGQVLIDGERLSPRHVGLIGYLPEERGLYKKMKVGEQLIYFGMLRGLSHAESKKKAKDWVVKFGVETWWNKNIEDLSKGMAQKIQFISTALHEPKLIILDEPFSGFDPVNANLITQEILGLRERGATILFSTHRMESVEQLCDHLAMIHRSTKILEGSVKEVRNAFKNNIYEILFEGSISTLPEGFSLEHVGNTEEGLQKAHLKVPGEIRRPNEVIAALLPQVELHAFTEKIPSINDIFISQVNQIVHE
jgi:ABC-2 type transport system ATP-binding protein